MATCRVLRLSHRPYHGSLAALITEGEVVEAYRANGLSDAPDDPRVRIPVPCRRGP